MMAWMSPLSISRFKPRRISRPSTVTWRSSIWSSFSESFTGISLPFVAGADEHQPVLDLHVIGVHRLDRRKDAHVTATHVETRAVQVTLDLELLDIELTFREERL